MDKGSSMIRRFAKISGTFQNFSSASDVFESIFLGRSLGLNTEQLVYTEGLEQKSTSYLRAECREQTNLGGAELILSEEVEFEQFMKLMMNHFEQKRTEEKQSAVIRRTETGAQLNVQDRAEFRAVAGRPALSLSAKVSDNQSSSPRNNREIPNTEIRS